MLRLKAASLFFASLLLASGQALAAPDSAEEVRALMVSGDYSRALPMAETLARKGDVAAMLLLGQAWREGLGVSINERTAAGWYELAAQAGSPIAQIALAELIMGGRPGKPDYVRAAMLLVPSAQSGNVRAQHLLGVLAIARTPPDWTDARLWLLRAANSGSMESQYSLGLLFADGKGGPADLVQAALWLGKAAAQGHRDAQLEYGLMVFNGQGVQRNQTIGAQWILASAGQGQPVAQNRMALVLMRGLGLPADPVEAMKWNILALDQGRPDAGLDAWAATQSPALQAEARARAKAFVPANARKTP